MSLSSTEKQQLPHDLLDLIRDQLHARRETAIELSAALFCRKEHLPSILNGSRAISDHTFEVLLGAFHIPGDTALLKQWIASWICYKLKGIGPRICRKAGLL